MTATDVAVRDPQASAIPAKLQYARALAESGLLPSSYRKNPANVLWAAEYGDMLGIGTMAAITGVHVIDGKPTASAGLISALVRRAGHKLRVHGDADAATCQIVRSDDPGYTFEVTFTAKDAQAAGLLSKDVWKKYRPSMLKARAITQCARDACEEALFGLHYTAEELGANVDEDGVVIGEAVDDTKSAPVRIEYGPGGSLVIDPDCLADPDEPAPDDGQRWADIALAQAASFKTEAEGQKLWRESAAAVLDGRCTPGEATHIQNLINARVADRRREASDMILRQLSETDDWRSKVEELSSDEDAREALGELGRLKAAGQVNETRAGRIGGAIIARFPKAVIKAGDDGA